MKKFLVILSLILCCKSYAQEFDKAVNEIEVKYHNYTLDIKELDSLINRCPDISKFPYLLFYKGNIHFDKVNYPLAIKSFLEAKKYAKEYLLRYDILNNLGNVYDLTNQTELSIAKFKEALELAQKNNNKNDVDYAYENLLVTKTHNGDLKALKEFETFFLNKNYDNLCSKLESLSLISRYYIKNNLYEDSKNILNKATVNIKTIDSCFLLKQIYYQNWADLSLHNNQYKKALNYLDSIPLKHIKLGQDKLETFKRYKEVYQYLGDNQKVILYNDSIVKILEDNLEYYNNTNTAETIKDLDNQEITERKITALKIFLSTIFCITIILALWLIYSKKTRFQLKSKINFYKDKYNNLWSNYQISNQQLKKLKEELTKQPNNVNTLIKDLSLYLNNNVDDEHKHINIIKDNFINALQEKAPYLGKQEQLVCFFINLNLSHKKIAELLNKTEKSIDSYKYRINKKVKENHNTNAEELINTIKL